MEPNSPYLHIGSGTHYADGWCNVDSDGVNNRVDFTADATDLPFADKTFTKLYMGHFLEHIPLGDIMDDVMDELYRVTTRDCQIGVVGPDMDRAVAQQQPQWLLDAIVEHGPPPGGHAWTATGENTAALLHRYGIVAEEINVSQVFKPEWPNPAPGCEWQFAFIGTWGT